MSSKTQEEYKRDLLTSKEATTTMKIKTEKASKTFEPVIMTITFESKEELIAMWHRMNLSTDSFEKVKKVYSHPFDSNVDNLFTTGVWRECNKALKQL